jgi:HAD superfamily hydrolase (TIGR01549 family)
MAGDRGVILDVDGTLIDSNDAHARAWSETGDRLGYDISYDKVRPLIGMGGDRVIPLLTGVEADSPEGEEISEVRGEIFRQSYLSGIQAFPRTRELVQRLADDGFDIVVASSASESDLAALLETAGVADLVRSATSAGDADASKPAPDIVEAAIARANVPRDGLLMIGDTPYDVEAARRARVPIVAVRCGGWDSPDLDDAAAIYDDPADLLAHYVDVFLDRTSGYP